jgi:hypothetical protein
MRFDNLHGYSTKTQSIEVLDHSDTSGPGGP